MLSSTSNIKANSAFIWKTLIDIETWPRWTPTVTSVTKLDKRYLTIGSQALLKQPKLKDAIWTITELIPSKSFDWESKVPGAKIVASHLLEEAKDGCSVTLGIAYKGPLAWFYRAITGTLSKEYLVKELAGLKRYCEGREDRSN